MHALETAREIADCILAPRAQTVDQSDSPPLDNIRILARAGLMGFTTPVRFGGIGASGSDLRSFTEYLAAACGVTTFVQGQHQSAALLIAAGENDSVKQELLPSMASGEVICGVAFSHIRRPGEPVLRAREDGAGFVFDGVAPWVTGWGIMREVVLGGTLEDGRLLYAVASLEPSDAMVASQPMRLCAMNASGTVSITFRGFRVPRDRHVKTITRDQMSQNDVQAILGVTAQPFGVSRASIALLRQIDNQRGGGHMLQSADLLEKRLEQLRAEVDEWSPCGSDSGFRERALEIRARCITHGVRCAHAALTGAGGRGNSLDHPAQRFFREAMFYTLTAQTPDVQGATLSQIGREASERPDQR